MAETLGGWGEMVLSVVKILTTRLADRDGRKISNEKTSFGTNIRKITAFQS